VIAITGRSAVTVGDKLFRSVYSATGRSDLRGVLDPESEFSAVGNRALGRLVCIFVCDGHASDFSVGVVMPVRVSDIGRKRVFVKGYLDRTTAPDYDWVTVSHAYSPLRLSE